MDDYLAAAARGRGRRHEGQAWADRARAVVHSAVASCAREFAGEGQQVADALRRSRVRPTRVAGTLTKRYWELPEYGLPPLATNGAWCRVTSPRGGAHHTVGTLTVPSFSYDDVGRVSLHDLVDADGVLVAGAEIPTSFCAAGFDSGWSGVGIRGGRLIVRGSTSSTTTGEPFRDVVLRAVERTVQASSG